jgi:uncharacterized membrane protein
MAVLFFVGSCLGWIIEVLFRRFCTAKKWINPGFLTGPYLPLYGFGLVGLFGLCYLPINTGMAWLDAVLIILIMGVVMTLIEYIAGLIFIKGMGIKLWDYSDRWGNIQGIICPLFTLFWTVIGAFYYFVIDPFVINWVIWFVEHIEFAFIVGIFFGVFFVDLGHSINIAAKISAFAKKSKVVVSFEKVKEYIKDSVEKVRIEKEEKEEQKEEEKREHKRRAFFWLWYKTPNPLQWYINGYCEEVKKSLSTLKTHRQSHNSKD